MGLTSLCIPLCRAADAAGRSMWRADGGAIVQEECRSRRPAIFRREEPSSRDEPRNQDRPEPVRRPPRQRGQIPETTPRNAPLMHRHMLAVRTARHLPDCAVVIGRDGRLADTSTTSRHHAGGRADVVRVRRGTGVSVRVVSSPTAGCRESDRETTACSPHCQ